MSEKEKSPSGDRFERLAGHYDGWIGWSARLKKEMPFLLDRLAGHTRVLDVGAGTGMHALALASEGFQVTALDSSASMLDQARAQTGAEQVQWVEADISQANALTFEPFDAVLAVGNVLLALGDDEVIDAALEQMLRLVNPGGILLLQYLNVVRIRNAGRLVVKAAGKEDEETIWLRHHFAAGPELCNLSYVLTRSDGKWDVELRQEGLAEITPERIASKLQPSFETIEFYQGLTGLPYEREESDAIGVLAVGRR